MVKVTLPGKQARDPKNELSFSFVLLR
jgi:hypothetical protein